MQKPDEVKKIEEKTKQEIQERIRTIQQMNNTIGQFEFNKKTRVDQVMELNKKISDSENEDEKISMEVEKTEIFRNIGELETNKWTIMVDMNSQRNEIDKIVVETLTKLGFSAEEAKDFQINLNTGEVTRKE